MQAPVSQWHGQRGALCLSRQEGSACPQRAADTEQDTGNWSHHGGETDPQPTGSCPLRWQFAEERKLSCPGCNSGALCCTYSVCRAGRRLSKCYSPGKRNVELQQWHPGSCTIHSCSGWVSCGAFLPHPTLPRRRGVKQGQQPSLAPALFLAQP